MMMSAGNPQSPRLISDRTLAQQQRVQPAPSEADQAYAGLWEGSGPRLSPIFPKYQSGTHLHSRGVGKRGVGDLDGPEVSREVQDGGAEDLGLVIAEPKLPHVSLQIFPPSNRSVVVG